MDIYPEDNNYMDDEYYIKNDMANAITFLAELHLEHNRAHGISDDCTDSHMMLRIIAVFGHAMDDAEALEIESQQE